MRILERKLYGLDLGIVQVCQRIYAEARQLLWDTNEFHPNDPRASDICLREYDPAPEGTLSKLFIFTWLYTY